MTYPAQKSVRFDGTDGTNEAFEKLQAALVEVATPDITQYHYFAFADVFLVLKHLVLCCITASHKMIISITSNSTLNADCTGE